MGLKKFKVELLGIIVFLSAFGSACALSMSRFYSVFEVVAIFFGILFLGTFIRLYHLELGQMKISHLNQINLFVFGGIFSAFLKLFYAKTEKWHVNVLLVLWLVASISLLLRYYLAVRKNESKQKMKIFESIMKYKYFCVIFIVIIWAGIRLNYLEPHWDSGVVFRRMSSKTIGSLFYLQDLTISGHLNIGYVVGNLLNIEIFKSARMGMQFGNIFVLIIGAVAFYNLLKLIVPGKEEWIYALTTAIFSFSPFLLGMVHVFCWDYWMICLFPLVVLTAYQKKWILHFGVALLFCFLKEPAIVVYAFFCAGVLLYDIMAIKRQAHASFKSICFEIIRKPSYWLMCIIGACWAFLYVMLTHWSGGGEFAINISYILDKLSVLYVLNFNWLFLLLSVISLFHFARKSWTNWQWMAPMLLADMAFVIFSCLFETSNHARYVDSHVGVMYLFTGALVIDFGNHVIRKSVAVSALAGIMLLSSFFTVDPLSLCLFDTLEVGGGRIITTGKKESISDSIVYNFQYMGFETATLKALQDIAGEVQVVFPLVNNNVWYFDGISDFKQQENFDITQEFWDESQNVRRNMPEENLIELSLMHIADEADLEDYLEPSTKYAYIFLENIGEKQAEKIRKNYNVLEEKTFQSGSFILDRIIFEIEKE